MFLTNCTSSRWLLKGQNTKGEVQTLLGELVAVREELSSAEERFSVIPADTLLDLPAHPAAPENLRAGRRHACSRLPQEHLPDPASW